MSKSGVLSTVQWIAVVNGYLDRHRCLLRTRVEKPQLLETFKNKFVMPEDRAIISSKSDVDPCTPDRDIDPTKKCRQTDGRTAFQLYIVDFSKVT